MELVEDEFDEGDDDAPGAGVARYLLYIEYIGTRLHGMQLQGAGLRTVAGCVEVRPPRRRIPCAQSDFMHMWHQRGSHSSSPHAATRAFLCPVPPNF